jgi:crotonobetainyl-CoA:carnitine CoA-transferase CaiB-like acyl-CoA transferase
VTQKPLSGFKLVTLALNVPGPVAAARLVELGMKAIKVEPPAGDALKSAARPWYDSLTREQIVMTLDLKNAQDSSKLG